VARRKTIRALFEDINNLTSEDIIKSQALKQLLKVQVPVCILDAHNTKKQYASVFEINETENYVDIHRRDWVQALETCILWYLETEEYEKCSKIRMIIEEIQKKPKTKINVKTEQNGE